MSSLAPRPEATTYTIQDLVLGVRRGRIRIPTFHGSFQWKQDDVVAVFDSVYRGFPIGNVLMWKHPARAERVEVGPILVDTPELTEALWVVDGQQRIMALAGALLRQQDTGDDSFDVYFDLTSEEFLAPGRRRVLPHWLPVNAALDTQTLLEWVMVHAGHKERLEQGRVALRLGKTLVEYRVPTYVVEAEDEKTLHVVFERMNTTGPEELAAVYDAVIAHPGDPPTDVDELARDVAAVGFGALEDSTLLKSIFAIEGLDVTQPIEALEDSDASSDAIGRAGPALRRAITFLREDAAVPHIELMPATFALVPLARFFALHPDPRPRSRVLLGRWLWRAFADHLRHGQHPSRIQRAVDAIDEREEESIQRLLAATPREPWHIGELPPYNWQSGTTKLVLAALAALAPRDLTTGALIDLPAVISRFGSRSAQSIDPARPGDSLGNRILHPPSAAGTQTDYATLLAQASDTVRHTHCAGRHAGGEIDIAEVREREVAAHVDRFLASRMAVVHSDRPSLRHILERIVDDDAA
jgi:hypothetical protein